MIDLSPTLKEKQLSWLERLTYWGLLVALGFVVKGAVDSLNEVGYNWS